jgi:hypothetical protein
MRYLAHESEFSLAARAAKYSSSNAYNQSSKRGRNRPSS